MEEKPFFFHLEHHSFELPKEWQSCVQACQSKFPDWAEFIRAWYTNLPLHQYSSGSTGTPKKLELDRHKMWQSAKRTVDFFNLKPGNNILICLSPNYIAGKMQWMRAVVGQLDVFLSAPQGNVLQNLNQLVDFAAMTPMQAIQSVADLHKLKTLLLGGSGIQVQQLELLLKNPSKEIWIGYGMSETYSHVALRSLYPEFSNWYKPMEKVVFRLIPNDCLHIDDKLLELNFETTDLVEINHQGQMQWHGRADFIVNSGGIKLQVESLEILFGPSLPFPFFLAGENDVVLGKRLVLIAENPPEYWHFESWIETQIKEGIHKIQLPKAVYALPKFIVSESGKLLRLPNLKALNLL